MKRYLKKLGITVVAGLTALSIVGCSSESASTGTSAGSTSEVSSAAASSSEEEKKEMTIEERVANAQEVQTDVQNMQSKMVMEMDFTSQGQSLATETTMNIVAFMDPLKMKIEMDMDMGDAGSQYMAIYGDQTEDGKYMMYMTDGTQWQSQEVPVNTFDQYDTRNSIDTYLEGVTDLKEAGTEEINGKTAIKIDGKITGDALEETIKYSGTLDNLKQTFGGQLDDATLESLFHDLGDITVSLWLDEETNLPLKYNMDMTSVMAKLYDNLFSSIEGGESIDLAVTKVIIGVEDIHYNDAEDFEIPAEAKQ